ncbi:hypothetical protein C0992_012287, partial [Termitomyces sp. T32_za158]
MAEQKQVLDERFDHHFYLAYNSLGWVFNHSSNHSVKDIVIEGTCGLFDENRTYPFRDPVSLLLSSEDNLSVSAITYALSRLPDSSSTSSKEDEIEKSTVYGQLLATLMQVDCIRELVKESTYITPHLKDLKVKITDALIEAYAEALRKEHYTLSLYLVEWGRNLLQSD